MQHIDGDSTDRRTDAARVAGASESARADADSTDGGRRSAGRDEGGAEPQGSGIMWTGIAVVVAIALAVLAAFQNTQDVDVEFLWLDGRLPLVLLLLITVGTTVVVTEAIGFVWRRRRRRRIRERRELRRLRKS